MVSVISLLRNIHYYSNILVRVSISVHGALDPEIRDGVRSPSIDLAIYRIFGQIKPIAIEMGDYSATIDGKFTLRLCE
jgi:hypothetical protein